MKLSTILTEARKDKNLSQEVAAKRMGLNPVSLSRYENGHTVPSSRNLIKLVKFYGLDFQRVATAT
jgi:transcriptional regulator with XRE-family HTH domain